MAAGVRIQGMDKVISRLSAGELYGEMAMRVAIRQAMNVVRSNARLLLADWYHSHPKATWEVPRAGSLYKSFRNNIIMINGHSVAGEVTNTDPAALWVEKGTKAHEIPFSKSQVHIFPGPEGPVYYSKHPHMVSGIDPADFMSEALQMSRPKILEIFSKVFRNPQMAAEGNIDFGISSGIDAADSIEETISV